MTEEERPEAKEQEACFAAIREICLLYTSVPGLAEASE